MPSRPIACSPPRSRCSCPRGCGSDGPHRRASAQPRSNRGPPRRVAVAGRDERPVPDGASAQAGASGRARGGNDHAATSGSRTRSGRSDPGLQQRWVRWVLDEVLELRDAVAEATDADPSHRVAEHGGDAARFVRGPRPQVRTATRRCCSSTATSTGTALSRPMPGERWAASPLDRAAELARATGVPLALVTDGARWTLVWAREGESTGMCTWRSELWLEEPITLRAFVTLLGARRFFALPVEEGLAALLAESAGKQQEVADQLGGQVRRAVELLITTLDYAGPRAPRRAARGTRAGRGVPRSGHRDDAAGVPVRRRGAAAAADRRPPLRGDARREHAARPAPGAGATARARIRSSARPRRGTGSWRCSARCMAGSSTTRCGCPPTAAGCSIPTAIRSSRAAGPVAAGASRRRTRCRSTTARCCTCSTRYRPSSRAARRVLLSYRGARRRADRPRVRGPTRSHRGSHDRHRRSRSPASSSPSSASASSSGGRRWAGTR